MLYASLAPKGSGRRGEALVSIDYCTGLVSEPWALV